MGRVATDSHARRRLYFDQGYTQEQIAKMEGIAQEAASRDERRMILFSRGLSQQEIADLEGVSKPAIISWRKTRGIAPNIKKEEKYEYQNRRQN